MTSSRLSSFALCAAWLATFSFLLPFVGNAASARIHLTPNFSMGQSFRYHIESRTTTTGTTTTPIVNPEAASQLKQVADLEVRLDVVGVQPATNGTAGDDPWALKPVRPGLPASSASTGRSPVRVAALAATGATKR